ncbi:Integrator complex subunit 10 [Triplophysa tibetana]|uniref:Integrator complex subunit 10 n=1 Tax=Triplophysa tibetana TaxID=1572043 RepID=A0A5A9NLG2_9TELE|nr:Integrator complex subunit 10 [Triplophysa tibetana]
MSAQGDCEFLVKRARELEHAQDPYAAKAWLITARTLYPTDFNIQYEMYSIERNAERTASAGRMLYDIFINFPEQPVVWREIAVITAALRNDSLDKHAQFLKGEGHTLRLLTITLFAITLLAITLLAIRLLAITLLAIRLLAIRLLAIRLLAIRLLTITPFLPQHNSWTRGVFETLPGPVQCQMLLKATEQCFNTLEKAEMLLLLLKRFPESVVQHGVTLGESLLEAETVEKLDTPVNCFRKLFVCDVLPLVLNNPEMCLPASLLYKYLHKAAEFYICYVTREPSADGQRTASQEVGALKSPGRGRGQRCVIDGLSEKSSVVTEPWERLLEMVAVMGSLCDWQGEKGIRSYSDLLQRVTELCRYVSADAEEFARCCGQIVTCCTLVLFYSAVHYVSAVQPSLIHSQSSVSVCPWVLLEDLSCVYTDVEVERKHAHKKRKLADGREKTMSSDDEDVLCKGRGRHIQVNTSEMSGWAETLEHFRTARESWELLHSHQSLETEFVKMCTAWRTETWLWLRIFLTDMIIYQVKSHRLRAVHALSSLAVMSSLQQTQSSSSVVLDTHRCVIQQASCHYALGEFRMACEKLLEAVSGLIPQNEEVVKSSDDQRQSCIKPRRGNDLRLVPCTSKSILPFSLQLMLACFKLRTFTDNRDDLALGHVIVLLQYDWPQGESLFLKAVDKICQQGSFQYENFFNYVTNIDMLEEFAYLRTSEGGRVQLELLPNQGMLIKNPSPSLGAELNTLLLPGAQKADRHHTVTRGITKGVKEDFRLAMERQVSRCGENLLTVLHKFCINEKIILIQSLP